MIAEAIKKITRYGDLTQDEAFDVMNEIMDGKATPTQTSCYLTALSMKKESTEEIIGSARAMKDHALSIKTPYPCFEIVGTGGDDSLSFNISTTASFIISAAGVPVAKHGNRAASSRSGAADCLEALGINISLDEKKTEELLKKTNFCFLFAQKYHTSMKYVAPIRKELGIKTIFNILGPLTNPANAKYGLIGVYSEGLLQSYAKALESLGMTRAMVVYGQDRMDEISLSSKTSVCELKDGDLIRYDIKPEDFGYDRCRKEEIVGGSPEDNAKILRAILLSKDDNPYRTQITCLNAGAALYVAGKTSTILEGVRLSEKLIKSGEAYKKLEEVVKESNK